MRENKLTIQINSPVEVVFDFTTDPTKTPEWIDFVNSEEVDAQPVRVGTKYRNRGNSNDWTAYRVTEFERNKLFTLASVEGSYHVRYTYREIEEGRTEMEYYEWVNKGELDEPFDTKHLTKLKEILES